MKNLLNKTDGSSRTARNVAAGLALLLVGSMAASQSHYLAASHAKVPDVKRSLTQASDRLSQPKISESVGKLPLAFEPNQGQTESQVKYIARAKGYTAFLTADEAMLRVKAAKGKQDGLLEMKLRNANTAPRIVASSQQSSISNYFIGSDRSKWHTNVPNFGKVTYEEVYPGIDVVYSGNQHDLEYDLVVKPGSDPSRIRVAYEGSSRFDLDKAGDLELQTSAGTTLVRKPVVYQTIGGARHSVDASYVVMASNEVSFKIGAYDASQALIIDPVVTVVSFLGGTGNDSGAGIATQATGNPTGVYIVGTTTSTTFVPTPAGFQKKNNGGVTGNDVVVVGLDPTGARLVYSTYLGGSGDDTGTGIAVDASGNAYVTGFTQSLNYVAPAIGFPSATAGGTLTVPTGAAIAGFVVKINAAGTALGYSVLVGGAGVTHSNAIALDPTGNAFIGGDTTGLSSPSTAIQNGVYGGGPTDGFVGQVNTTGAFTFSAYMGGNGTGAEAVNAVATDAAGNVYVTGTTSSNASVTTPFPTFPKTTPSAPGAVASTAAASTVGFAASIPAALTGLTYSATFGGGGETAAGLAVTATGTAFITGNTQGTAFAPAVTTINGAALGATQQPYLLALTATGTKINWLDYPAFAGTATGVALDNQSQAYVSGTAVVGGASGIDGTLFRFNNPAKSNVFSFVDISGTGTDVLNGVSVNASHLAFVVGTSNTAAMGLSASNSNGPAVATANGLLPVTGATPVTGTANLNTTGGTNLAYAAVQYNDIAVSPGTLSFSTGAGQPLSSVPAQFITLSIVNPASQSACFAAAPTPVTTGNFSATAVAGSTSVFSIVPTGSTATPGPQLGTVTFTTATCPGPSNADNNGAPSATVSLTFTVGSSITAVPSSPLNNLSEALGSGIVSPLSTTNGGAAQATVTVTSANASIPYTVAVAAVPAPSANIAALGGTCGATGVNTGLFFLNKAAGTTSGTSPGSDSFTINVNPGCANNTPGVYTETINVTGPGLNTVGIPIMLTVGGGITFNGFPTYEFTSSSAPAQSTVSTLTATGTAGSSFSYAVTYVPNTLVGGTSPLPASAVSILAGGSGTIPAGSTGSLNVQVTPTGLANGVYAGNLTVSPTGSSTFASQTRTLNVTVGGGLVISQPGNGSLTLTLPVGLSGLSVPASVLPSSNIILFNGSTTSNINVSAPTVSSSLTGVVTFTGGGGVVGIGNSIAFGITFNTPLTPQVLTGTITITGTPTTPVGASPITATIPVTLNVVSLPSFNGFTFVSGTGLVPLPASGIFLTGVSGGPPVCSSNNFATTSLPLVGSSGGPIGATTITATSGASFISGGSITAPGAFVTINGANSFPSSFQICANPQSLGATASGIFTGAVTFSSSGAAAPLVIPVTLAINNVPGTIDLSNTGVFRGGTFLENTNQTTYNYLPASTLSVSFGQPGDQPVAGDWLGSGMVSLGIFRGGAWFFDLNNDGIFQPNEGPFFFGQAGDIAIVGDWTGSGSTKVGVFRGGTWYLSNQTLPAGTTAGTTSLAVGTNLFSLGTLTPAAGYSYGQPGDQPVANNWSGASNVDQIGVFRCPAPGVPVSCSWFVDNIGDGVYRTSDPVYSFGQNGDTAIVGDWNDKNGKKRLGVFRNGVFILDVNGSNTFAPNDIGAPGSGTGLFGQPGDVPIIGKWTN